MMEYAALTERQKKLVDSTLVEKLTRLYDELLINKKCTNKVENEAIRGETWGLLTKMNSTAGKETKLAIEELATNEFSTSNQNRKIANVYSIKVLEKNIGSTEEGNEIEPKTAEKIW